jgi:2,5-dioxopentanoate dehydrogenase
MTATLRGRSLLGFGEGFATSENFYAVNPATGGRLDPPFSSATPADVESAARFASGASAAYSRTSGGERAAFLRRIASNIEAIAADLVERAHLETALPKLRLQGEAGRTCGQLRLFATLVEEGSWVGARIDRAEPDRKPLPKPDIRSLLRPLGPVGVFGASNFPLAFSVAGGDTASALAAGNPVIVKAHPAHPGTSELAGEAIRSAVKECGLPEGIFSLLFDSGVNIGIALVTHSLVKAVGFTGSRKAGRALMDLAASRAEPIPFFAEMSSTNPVFVLPDRLREQGETIAAGLHASFTLGAGQFCTKPGMIFVPQEANAQDFVHKLRDLVKSPAEFTLLTSGIRSAYRSAVTARKDNAKVHSVQPGADESSEISVGAVLFETDAASFLGDVSLGHEVFGPSTLLVQHCRRDELLQIARNLEGHLTATIHATDRDLRDYSDLIEILESRVGRLILNAFPTGVEVTHAMVHGGPYPATSDGRFTSVGSQAIFRFARPVCYQGFPDHALPEELQDANPLGIWRMLDGQMTRAVVADPAKKAG